MSHLDLAKSCISDASSVDPVEFIDDTFLVEFLDNTDSLLADSGLSLLGACTAMVCAVDSSVLGDWVSELSCLDSGLAIVDVGANPEVGARLELCEQSLLIDNVTA